MQQQLAKTIRREDVEERLLILNTIRRHGSVSGVKYIERYREIYVAREATVYPYASR